MRPIRHPICHLQNCSILTIEPVDINYSQVWRKEGRVIETEIQWGNRRWERERTREEEQRQTARVTQPDRRRLSHWNGVGQTDRNIAQDDRNSEADCLDNRGVYQPISNSSMSFYLPASLSCVDMLEPCCLTEVASWALNNVSAEQISPHDVFLMLSLPPYLPQIEVDC